jgi:hypothetical protein
MALKISTGLANAQLTTGGIKSALTGMLLYVYGGTEPATADTALGAAVLLLTVSDAGGGGALTFAAAAVAGVLEKNSSQVWQGTVGVTGTATFCRLALPADGGGASTTAVRIQGDVGVVGKFLNMSSVALTASSLQKVDYLSLAQPLQ